MKQAFFQFDVEDVEREIQLREPEGSITLRPYQGEAVGNVFDRWNAGDQATLVCIPTGGGKSVVFSAVMKRWTENENA